MIFLNWLYEEMVRLNKRGFWRDRSNIEVVTVQELASSNMLEIEALRQLLFEKGIIAEG